MSDDELPLEVEAMGRVLLQMMQMSAEELAAYKPTNCCEALAKKIALGMCSENEKLTRWTRSPVPAR